MSGVAVANARRRLFEATVAASPPAASSSAQTGDPRGGTACDLAQRLFPQASQLAPTRAHEAPSPAGVSDVRPAVPPRPGTGAGTSFRFGGSATNMSPSRLANSRPAPSATVPTEETLPPRGRVRDHVANFEKRCATPNPARPERSDMRSALGPRSASAAPIARSNTPSRSFPESTAVRTAPAQDPRQRANLRRTEAAVVPPSSAGSLRALDSTRQGHTARPANLDLTQTAAEPGGDDEASEVVFGMSPVKRAASQAMALSAQERMRPASAARFRDGCAQSGAPGAVPPAASLAKVTSTSALVHPPQDAEEEIPSVRARVRQFDSGARRSRIN